ncbi:MAG: cytochrome c oxidase subunit 3 family protein [Proteobacteria bacterium]|nr:cytochrome c oxidase subunit 3 family protein [Pseudomonadota bacterium]
MEMHNDTQGKKIGMWLFLYTEIMLFGGLFVLYAVYYSTYSADFVAGGKELDIFFGVLNTVILLVSSFAVAASITAIRTESLKTALVMVGIAIACGLFFLVNKYLEWGHKIEVGIYPNSEVLLDGEPGRNIFFGLYYTITGLHGLHVIIGLTLLVICLVMLARQKITAGNDILLENSGLYWHLVDLIWIFIFPLFYLVL